MIPCIQKTLKYWIGMFAILSSLSVTVAQSLNWSSESTIAKTQSGGNVRPRIVCLDERHGIILWGSEPKQSISYALWEDDQFSAPTELNIEGKNAFVTEWASTEIAGRGSRVYIVFKENPAESGKIYLLRSDDFGKTFTKPIPVVDPVGFLCRFPGVAIDANNNPIVTYMRFNTDWSDPRYVSIRSTDSGNSFDAYKEIMDKSLGEACDCCPVSIISDQQRVAVLFRNNRNNIRNMTAAVSFDDGDSYNFSKELDTLNWTLFSCPAIGGDAFFADQYLNTSWLSGRTGTNKAYYSKLNLSTGKLDDFRALTNPLGRNLQQTDPRICGRADTVGLCWNELANGMDAFFSYYLAGNSKNLETNVVRVNTAANGNQSGVDMDFVNGAFYLTWKDATDYSIRFRKVRFSSVSSADAFSNSVPVQIHYQNNIVQLLSEVDWDQWQITDLSGNVRLKGNAQIQLEMDETWQPGWYLLSLYSAHRVLNYKFIIAR